MERSFYCRSCRLTARGRWIPAGWYVLERALAVAGGICGWGLYCSLASLAAAGSDLDAAEQDAGVRGGACPPVRLAARLAAPRRAVLLYLRAYWPEQQILDGTWAPPPDFH